MAARVGLGHLLDNFEDLRRRHHPLLGFAKFLWMDVVEFLQRDY
jgi:hypothetical protein